IALKVMLPSMTTTPQAHRRFLREAQAIAALTHDHIITIYQVGEDRGVLYLAMQLLQGQTLEERLRQPERFAQDEGLRIGREIAPGLSAAHQRGMLHRDIKPANIWLEAGTGRVKILDFGLARPAQDNVQLTQEGALAGTPQYMAPEQIRNEKLDHRC